MDKLTNGQKLALGAGVVLLVASFLPWYSAFGFSINAWDAEFLAWFGVICGVAAAIVIGLKAFGTTNVAAGGFAAEQIAVVLGALSVILILLRFLTESSSVSFGLFLGLVAAAAVAYGSFMAMKESGLDLPGKGGTGGAPPPTA